MGKADFRAVNSEHLHAQSKTGWKHSILNKSFASEFILSLIILASALMLLANFLKSVERREGAVLNDPVLSVFPPIDLTWLIFALIYGCLILALISFAKNPSVFTLAIQSYSLLIFVRITAMYLVPLNPPSGMIALKDPLVEFFGTGMLLTKDLFFSGHTALLSLFFLIEKNNLLKMAFLASAVTVGICLLMQHVHYSLDVFAAPFFSYAAYGFVLKVRMLIALRHKNTSNR